MGLVPNIISDDIDLKNSIFVLGFVRVRLGVDVNSVRGFLLMFLHGFVL